MHLLLISDDEFQSAVLAGAALRRGATVESVTAADAVTGLPRPDAAIVDCETLDGAALDQVRAVSALCPNAALFVLAEQISEQGREQLTALHVRHVQSKPFYPKDLLERVEQAVRPDRRRKNSPMRATRASLSRAEEKTTRRA